MLSLKPGTWTTGTLVEWGNGRLTDYTAESYYRTCACIASQQGLLTLEIEACDKQFDCVVMQDHPDRAEEPLWYWSRALNAAEENYDTIHREYLAVIRAPPFLWPYLEEQSFTTRTDHDALKLTPNIVDGIGRLARWRLLSSGLELDPVQREWIKNQATDAESLFDPDVADQHCSRTIPSKELFRLSNTSNPTLMNMLPVANKYCVFESWSVTFGEP